MYQKSLLLAFNNWMGYYDFVTDVQPSYIKLLAQPLKAEWHLFS